MSEMDDLYHESDEIIGGRKSDYWWKAVLMAAVRMGLMSGMADWELEAFLYDCTFYLEKRNE